MKCCLLCASMFSVRKTFLSLLPIVQEKWGVCSVCQDRFTPLSTKGCPRCCREGNSEVCTDCREWERKGHVVCHNSLYSYTETMADYMSRYKFQGDYLLRQVFADSLRTALRQYSEYTVVPIPLAPKRLEERGFNQVTGLLKAAGISYHHLLEKEETSKQSEKTRAERLAINQPFSLKEDVHVPENILLVDDIYTTGMTLYLAQSLLMKAGAKKIKTFSLAR